jgi:bifunctional DNA-binding transcriptional regulator/antitoxin component of YhaV-PrlF toxin-antitoxin module
MPRLLGKSRVWGRGYTTIPVTVRRILELCNGDEIEWYMGDNGEIIIRKVGGRNE